MLDGGSGYRVTGDGARSVDRAGRGDGRRTGVHELKGTDRGTAAEPAQGSVQEQIEEEEHPRILEDAAQGADLGYSRPTRTAGPRQLQGDVGPQARTGFYSSITS